MTSSCERFHPEDLSVCEVYEPGPYDRVAPAHGGGGFKPTGKRGEIAPWKWNPYKPITWGLDPQMEGMDMAFEDVAAIAKKCFGKIQKVCGLAFKWIEDWHPADKSAPDIRIYMRKEQDYSRFHANSQILGLGWFPNPMEPKAGQIILNGSYHWGDGGDIMGQIYLPDEYETKKSIVLGFVMLHEIGHTLGLPHADKSCGKCVMAPVYSARKGWNGTFAGQDAARLVEMYGPPKGKAAKSK